MNAFLQKILQLCYFFYVFSAFFRSSDLKRCLLRYKLLTQVSVGLFDELLIEKGATTMKKKFFNLIEVLLALGVMAIGIMGIMAVIPVTLNANRDAAADNLIADVANTKFAEIALDVKKDFNANLKNNTAYSGSKPSAPTNWTPLEDVSGVLSNGNMTNDGILFSGTKFAMGRSGKAPDLTGDILLWKVNPGDVVGVAGNDTNPVIIRLYMEVSWPSSVQYEQRRKRVYVREFLDPAAAVAREPGS